MSFDDIKIHAIAKSGGAIYSNFSIYMMDFMNVMR